MARGTSVFDREGTVGPARIRSCGVAIRRADGALADAEEEGEIVVGGPTVMRGYHRDPAATAAAVRDGWLHTGDLGRRDGDGYFFITGRVKDLIITGGENVSPVEVEDGAARASRRRRRRGDRHAASELGRAGDRGRRRAATARRSTATALGAFAGAAARRVQEAAARRVRRVPAAQRRTTRCRRICCAASWRAREPVGDPGGRERLRGVMALGLKWSDGFARLGGRCWRSAAAS